LIEMNMILGSEYGATTQAHHAKLTLANPACAVTSPS
jgi:hypothetical protein